MYQRILVATDDSRLSRRAVRSAVALAASVGAELVALHVVPRYPTHFFEGAATYEPDDVGLIERQWAERGQSVVDRAVEGAKAAGVRARAVVTCSDRVAESVLATARKHKCDLIVMASHGRKGLQRVLLGSETQNVLIQSTLPVLVLR
jgi:nucleotide-binding universal stress UspA family protein